MSRRANVQVLALALLVGCDGGDAGADGGALLGDVAIVRPERKPPPTVRPWWGPQETATLTVELEGDGQGRVRSDPPGLDCALPCEGSFAIGGAVTLTLEPAYRSSLGSPRTVTVVIDGDRTIVAVLHHHEPLRLSDTDRDPDLRLRDDGLAVDFAIHGGVRSIESVAPGDGVFYFEGHVLVDDRGDLGFGIATASAPLLDTYVGATDQSFGAHADGSITSGGEWLGRRAAFPTTGLAVDYRGASPIVHVIVPGPSGAQVSESVALPAITAPIHVFAAGSKRAPDFQLAINAGADVENVPFALDPRAALRGAGLGEVADALVLGFGDSYAGPPDREPDLEVPADLVVTSGTPVVLSATALDLEDGDLSASIAWELLSSPHYAGRVRGAGPTFSFTPTAIGLHPARAWVRDRTGQVVERIVRVRVPGPVAQRDRVELAPDARSGTGIELAPDRRAARWTRAGKRGVRANQSLYGEWGYFEIHRLTEPVNQGGGVVTGDGNLDPYGWDDVPGSCSVNMLSGVWRELIWQHSLPGSAESEDTYGFAVDYRGEHPIVYVIASGTLAAEVLLSDVWTEVYPMIYGDPTYLTEPGEHDEAIAFGEDDFVHDPVAILRRAGIDTTGLVPGWGHANTR